MDTAQESLQYCQQLAKQHYENFPVASWLLPSDIRQSIAIIYAFARSADDIADEGDFRPQQRLNLLNEFNYSLQEIEKNNEYKGGSFIFIALSKVIKKHQLPVSLFADLITAFKSDVNNKEYRSLEQLLNYCRLSANPIGRLLLYLNNSATIDNFELSDNICSSLQLINFLQDIQQDQLEMNRLYIPICDINTLSINKSDLLQRIKSGLAYNKKEQLLIQKQIQRAEAMLHQGRSLVDQLTGRFRLEILMIVTAAELIIAKLKSNKRFDQRPRLDKRDKLYLFWVLITNLRK